jgi:ribosomal-protein-alanine N-acetyltransferase
VESIVEFHLHHWAENDYGAFAVRLKDSGALIGQCGAQVLEGAPLVEAFFAIGEAYWGQGYATEAVRAVIRFLFDEIKLRRVIGLTAPDNKAAERILRKLEMRYQRITRHYNMKLKQFTIEPWEFDYGNGYYEFHE